MAIVIKKCGGQCVSKVYQEYQHVIVSFQLTDEGDAVGVECVVGVTVNLLM